MFTTDIPLPTAWLAPPPKLLAANNPTKLEAAPLAISATLILAITLVVVILFNRRDAEIFQDDKMPKAEINTEAAPSTVAPGSQAMSQTRSPQRATTTDAISVTNPCHPSIHGRHELGNSMIRPAQQSTMNIDERSEPAVSQRFTSRSDDDSSVGRQSSVAVRRKHGLEKYYPDMKAESKARYSWEEDDLRSFASDTVSRE